MKRSYPPRTVAKDAGCVVIAALLTYVIWTVAFLFLNPNQPFEMVSVDRLREAFRASVITGGIVSIVVLYFWRTRPAKAIDGTQPVCKAPKRVGT